MRIRHLVWACIACGREGALSPRHGREICEACGTTYRRGRGAKIFVGEQGSEERCFSPVEISALLPDPGTIGSARCELRAWTADERLYVFGRYLGRYEKLGPARAGRVELSSRSLRFIPDQGQDLEVDLLDITAIQPSSQALQIKPRGRPLFALRFSSTSPRLWEERLHAALERAHAEQGNSLLEFQPRVCGVRSTQGPARTHRLSALIGRGAGRRPGRPWQYRLASWIARNAWSGLGGGVLVDGLENIPASGPFLVLANHQSYLETMLIPAVMPRAIQMMAKSTQFGVPVYGWLMARLFAFPVRRFEIDPQAIRYLSRRMAEGYGAVIFPEGERSWDGSVQALRLGVIRLALLARVPVIPCRVDGAFDAWPRWASRPQRLPIRIHFGRALELPGAASRADRESRLMSVASAIRAALDAPDAGAGASNP